MAKIELKHIFIFQTIAASFFGLGFMILPAFIMTLLGLSVEADGPTSMRFFGIMITGTALLAFCIRNEPHSSTRQAILIMLVFNFILMILFKFLFMDLQNIWVWMVIILHVVFIIFYGYFFIKNRGK